MLPDIVHGLQSIAQALLSQKPGKAAQSYNFTDQAHTTTSYAVLATNQFVQVVVGASGQMLVTISAGLYNVAAGKYLGFAVTGPNGYTLAADDTRAIRNDSSAFIGAQERTILVEGLAAGTYTVTLQARTNSGTAQIFDKRLIATPL